MTLRILAFLAKGIALTLAAIIVLGVLGIGSGTVAYVALSLADLIPAVAQ